MSDGDWLTQQFEQSRERLRAIAYRMLGSQSEADDAVQEAWLRLSRSDMVEFARVAEGVGFDSLWGPDYLLWRDDGATLGSWDRWPRPPPQCWSGSTVGELRGIVHQVPILKRVPVTPLIGPNASTGCSCATCGLATACRAGGFSFGGVGAPGR